MASLWVGRMYSGQVTSWPEPAHGCILLAPTESAPKLQSLFHPRSCLRLDPLQLSSLGTARLQDQGLGRGLCLGHAVQPCQVILRE